MEVRSSQSDQFIHFYFSFVDFQSMKTLGFLSFGIKAFQFPNFPFSPVIFFVLLNPLKKKHLLKVDRVYMGVLLCLWCVKRLRYSVGADRLGVAQRSSPVVQVPSQHVSSVVLWSCC